MHPDIEQLIKLQALEIRIRHLAARIDQFPRQMEALEAQLLGTRQQMDEQQQALRRIAAELRQLEGEIQVVEERVSRYRSQLTEVKTNEQYKALLHEIDFHTGSIGKMEDEILVKMEKEESLGAGLRTLEVRYRTESTRADREKQVAREEMRATEMDMARRQDDRRALIALIAPEVHERYRQIAGARKGVALASATEACHACHVRIRPSVLSQVMSGRQIVHCDRCGRFLYWNPEAADEAGAQ